MFDGRAEEDEVIRSTFEDRPRVARELSLQFPINLVFTERIEHCAARNQNAALYAMPRSLSHTFHLPDAACTLVLLGANLPKRFAASSRSFQV